MERKGFDRLYYFIDLHSTCIKPDYTAKRGEIPTQFYPMAKEALQLMSQCEDIRLTMYTCSHPHEISKYALFFEEHGINFDWVNENPEVFTVEGAYGNYDKKPYFNAMFEDKAGFNGEEDWKRVYRFFAERMGIIKATTVDNGFWVTNTTAKSPEKLDYYANSLKEYHTPILQKD